MARPSGMSRRDGVPVVVEYCVRQEEPELTFPLLVNCLTSRGIAFGVAA